MGRFLTDLKSFNTEVTRDVNLIRRKIMLEIGRRVILKTPVDKGGARGGWQMTTGAPATGDVERLGGEALAELIQVVGQSKVEDVMFFSNLTPYIVKLEHGGYPDPPKKGTGKTTGGFSTQAPRGMMRITLAEFEGIVHVITKETKFRG